ncbi:MAG: type II toxin-antitoxin system RelE/ParE family toxin [Gemmataceae bacterium]|nr:type II toxin-antitoxin system RelE/ParE family toxin [Gemmataceae bacterium]
MKSAFRKSFARDVKKIKDDDIKKRVQQVIEEVEKAADLQSIHNLKKLTGTAKYYRIRIGDHRIGVLVKADTVEFVRCLSRRDLSRGRREDQ